MHLFVQKGLLKKKIKEKKAIDVPQGATESVKWFQL